MGKRYRASQSGQGDQAVAKIERALVLIESVAVKLDFPSRIAVVKWVRTFADDLERAVVAGARNEGLSWSTIGAELGVSKSSACERFGPSTR